MDAAVANAAFDEILVRREAWYRRLWVQVLIAIALGGALGALFPEVGTALKPLGDALIKAIRMTIAPIVFCTVVHGIASMSDMRRAGRISWKALVYFEVGTTLALLVGLAVINLVRPGAGMHVDVATLDANAVQSFISRSQHETVTGFLLDIIPDTVVGAFANGEMLQVLFFAILFAIAAQRVGEPGRRMVQMVDDVAKIFIQLLGTIMRFAPIGAFGVMAFTIGKYGLGAVVSPSQFMLCFYATCLLFIFGILGVVCRLLGFSVWKLVRYLKEELLLVFGFSASEPVRPRFMVKMQKAGCGEPNVGLVIPTGYSFNLDGTCIYLTIAALFLAQATDTDLSRAQQVGIIGVLLLTSNGAAAVTGSGFIVLAATLGTIGHTLVARIALIFGIDRFMSQALALTNFIGTAVAKVVVSKWEGEPDERAFREALG